MNKPLPKSVPSLTRTPYINLYVQEEGSAEAGGSLQPPGLFGLQEPGVRAGADSAYLNASQTELRKNVRRAIQRQNQKLLDANASSTPGTRPGAVAMAEGGLGTFMEEPGASVSKRLTLKIRKFYIGRIFLANAQPFSKSWVYDESCLMRTSAQSVPYDLSEAKSLAICFDNRNEKADVTAFMVSGVSVCGFLGRGRLLTLKTYAPSSSKTRRGSAVQAAGGSAPLGMVDGITDLALEHFQTQYECLDINKEDVFYYVYGVLHSEDCRSIYRKDLRRDPPRIPMVQRLSDFTAFSEAGRKLAHLHVNYDAAAEYPLRIDMRECPPHLSSADYWRVEQMVFGSRGNRTKIVYNEWISVSGIPLDAYDYVISGRPAVVWVMESQGIKVHAASGIINDANCWATETVGDPAYPLKLLQRVITLALETHKIVSALPFLE